MIGIIVFAAPIIVGAFYGQASWHDSLTALFAWRRVLLLPLALAVFDDEPSKRLVLKTILIVSVVGAVASFLSAAGMAAAGVPSIGHWNSGIIFRNYATQGLTLTVAMVIVLAALLRPELFAGDRLLGRRAPMATAFVVLVLDIVFILPGRSGYVSVLVMGVATVVLLARGSWRLKLGLGAAVLALFAVLLVSSGQSRQRIAQAFNEIVTADDSGVGTSLGARVIFWRNTARMIADHPVLGVGTGGFQAGYRPYVEGVAGWRGDVTGDPHNQFLKFLAEQGVIGLAAVLFFIFRTLTCPAPVPYRQLAAAIMLGWCATSLANSHFSTFVEGRMLFFSLGALLAGPPMLRKADRPIT
jgi:O-antigen ligase